MRMLLSAMVCVFAVLRLTAQPLTNGDAVATFASGSNAGNFVVALMKVQDANLQPVNTGWNPVKQYGPSNSWTRTNLGEVFGICISNAPHIYVAATRLYGGSAGPGGWGGVYRLDGLTGAITPFLTTLAAPTGGIGTSTIPNTGPGLGNIAYDPVFDQFFVTNFEDGKIYRVNNAGIIQSTFDPFAADGGASGQAPIGERVFGIGVHNNHVYFSRWVEDCLMPDPVASNEIWSVALNGSGDFNPGSAQLEIALPPLPGNNWSNPVSDIEFNQAGHMLVAERTMRSTLTGYTTNAHASRLMEYRLAGVTWLPAPQVYGIGTPGVGSSCGSFPTGMNSSGGCDYGYGSWDKDKRVPVDCDSAVWSMGDALISLSVYGAQRLPASGGVAATAGVMVNLGTAKTFYGDIDIWQNCRVESDPCKGVRVIEFGQTQGVPNSDGGCCVQFGINNSMANTWTGFTVTANTPGVSINYASGPAGWMTTTPLTQVTYTHTSGFIPTGTSFPFVFCLNVGTTVSQSITISMVGANGVKCDSTFTLQCHGTPPPVPPCGKLQKLSVSCLQVGANGSTYSMTTQIQNLSWYTANGYNITVNSPAGVSVTPNSGPFVPVVPPMGISTTLPFTITVPAGVTANTLCLSITLHDASMQNCCTFDTCIVLPKCTDCCDEFDIKVPTITGTMSGAGAGTITSSLNAGPQPIASFTATIVSVTRGKVWCGGSVTSPGGPVAVVFTGGSLTPVINSAPVFAPPTSSVTWGTQPSGVSMSGPPSNLSLNVSMPNAALGFFCRDTITVCIRYSFTDTSCVTCDTTVCIRIPRKGSIIIHNGDWHHAVNLKMKSTTEGTLTLRKLYGPGQPHYGNLRYSGSPQAKLARMSLTNGGVVVVTDGVADAAVVMDEKTDSLTYDVVFENKESVKVFPTYAELTAAECRGCPEEASPQLTVWARIPGEQGGDTIAEDRKSTRPKNVRTYMLFIANGNPGGQNIASFRIAPSRPELSILAFGPGDLDGDGRLDLMLVESSKETGAKHLAVANIVHRDVAARLIAPGEQLRPIYITVAGDDGPISLDYTTVGEDGQELSNGDVLLEEPVSILQEPGDGGGSDAEVHMSAHPNPAVGDVSISIRSTMVLHGSRLMVVDINGRTVSEFGHFDMGTTGAATIQGYIGHLASGSYRIVLVADDGRWSIPLTITR